MINISESVTISRPPSEVFAFMANLDNIAKWNAEVQSFTVSTSGPTKAGSKFVEHTKVGGSPITVNCEVTEFTPSSRIVFTGESSPFNFEFTYTLEPAGAGTQLSLQGQVSPKGLMALLAPLMAGEIRGGVRAPVAKERDDEGFPRPNGGGWGND